MSVPTKTITPRAYQTELLEKARNSNVIIALGTGTGKTHIATMLLEDYTDILMRSCSKANGKRALFLVPSEPLVYQQAQYIEQHTLFRVGRYCGKEDVDSWNCQRWQAELEKYQVLVIIGQVFQTALARNVLNASNICLVIVDECHHARKAHPYRTALHNLARKVREQQLNIRVIGLTASVLNIAIDEKQLEHSLAEYDASLSKDLRKPKENASALAASDPIEKCIRELEHNMLDATVVQPANLEQVDMYGALPTINYHAYKLHAVDDELLAALGARGRQLLLGYDAKHLNAEQTEIIRRLTSMAHYVNLHLTTPGHRQQPKALRKLSNDWLRMLQQAIRTYKELGVLALFNVLGMLHGVFQQQQQQVMSFEAGKIIASFLVSEILLLRKMLILQYKVDELDCMPVEQARSLCSSAVLETLSLLVLHEKQCRTEQNRSFSAIIFARRRYAAMALKEIIYAMSMLPKSPYSCLRPVYVVGQGGLKEGRHRQPQQRMGLSPINVIERAAAFAENNNDDDMFMPSLTNVAGGGGKVADLQLFRDGHCNVLISTAVSEEGLDVPQCNLIIRFSMPVDYRGFIQSKGRARAKHSQYYVLVPDIAREIAEARINHFLRMYTEIVRRCTARVPKVEIADAAAAAGPEQQQQSNNDKKLFLFPPYTTPLGAELNTANSVSLLYQYCQHDWSSRCRSSIIPDIKCMPVVTYEQKYMTAYQYKEQFGELGQQILADEQRRAKYKLGNAASNDSASSSSSGGHVLMHVCTIMMPSGEKFVGIGMPTTVTAKKVACQLACQSLRQQRRINDNLQVCDTTKQNTTTTITAAAAAPIAAAKRNVDDDLSRMLKSLLRIPK